MTIEFYLAASVSVSCFCLCRFTVTLTVFTCTVSQAMVKALFGHLIELLSMSQYTRTRREYISWQRYEWLYDSWQWYAPFRLGAIRPSCFWPITSQTKEATNKFKAACKFHIERWKQLYSTVHFVSTVSFTFGTNEMHVIPRAHGFLVFSLALFYKIMPFNFQVKYHRWNYRSCATSLGQFVANWGVPVRLCEIQLSMISFGLSQRFPNFVMPRTPIQH